MNPVGPGTFAGAVLCGGASRRMGRDKALVRWQGVPMAVRVASALAAAGASPVFAVGGDEAALTEQGLSVVPDSYPGDGPLGGVITALRRAEGRPVVVVGCDLPRLTATSLRAVAAGLQPGVDVAVATTDRWQPVCAAWSAGVLPFLESALDSGFFDLSGRIATLRRTEVAIPAQDLWNVNTPSDLAQ